MPDYIPWEDLRDLADKHGLRQAVMAAWDGERTHIVTFGGSAEDSDMAAEGGNFVKRALGWPEALRSESPKVAKLREEIESLRSERDEARAVLCQCWDASGLLDDQMTGIPGQAWEVPSDLVGQVEELASKALGRDTAEAERDAAIKALEDAPTRARHETDSDFIARYNEWHNGPRDAAL
jgi:hypothetical protein